MTTIFNINKTQNQQNDDDNWMNLFDELKKTNDTSAKVENDAIACLNCGVALITNDSCLICKSCGLEINDTSGVTDEQHSASLAQDNNVNDKGFMSMRIIGKGAYGYHRSLLKSCAQYGQYRKMTTLKDIHNWNAQSNGKFIPRNVIEEANEMFAKIKEHGGLYRNSVKKGVISACIYYSCYNNGISQTPIETARLVGIAEKFHSAGDRILRDLNERGIIDLPRKIDPINDYLNRYLELLGIPIKYKDFIVDLIAIADREKLHIINDSKNNTKCIGAIYVLIDRVPELKKKISKDKIDKECEISKTTFIKYYNLVCKYFRKFVPVFIKHGIKMKKEWRDDITMYFDLQRARQE